MIDTFNLPNNSLNNQVFHSNGSTTGWAVWNKPNNAKFVYFMALGGGGGGGGGNSGGSGTARRGGGGGGSSSVTTGLFRASSLPDVLYVQVGQGGVGGIGLTTNSNGSAGGLSYVSVRPDSGHTSINMLLVSGTNAAGGGNSGLNSGTAGTAGTAWTGSVLSLIGLPTVYGGQIGALGSTTGIPPNVAITGITTGGAAGAGTNGATPQNGGNITGAGIINTVLGGQGSGATGSSGYISSIPSSTSSARQHMLFTGGAGGASSNLGPGGQGGSGAFGSGGAGGGAGITNLGGNGGHGGDGLVIITCW